MANPMPIAPPVTTYDRPRSSNLLRMLDIFAFPQLVVGKNQRHAVLVSVLALVNWQNNRVGREKRHSTQRRLDRPLPNSRAEHLSTKCSVRRVSTRSVKLSHEQARSLVRLYRIEKISSVSCGGARMRAGLTESEAGQARSSTGILKTL